MHGLSNQNGKIVSLEAARGVAALLVILYHANLLCSAAHLTFLNSFFGFGESAVDFFFVLSGFIITWVHRRDWGVPARSIDYLWRRFVRIYPTYWAATLLYAIPLFFAPWIRSSDLAAGWYFFLSNILLTPSTGFLVIPPAWTLQHEVLFYALFSVFILNRVVGALVFFFWSIAIVLVNIWEPYLTFPYRFLFNPVNLEFVIGMICVLVIRRMKRRTSIFMLLSGCVIFFGAAISQVHLHWLWTNLPAYPMVFTLTKGIGTAMIISGMLGVERISSCKPRKILRTFGLASYSLYLMHLPSMVFCLLVMVATGLLEKMCAEYVFGILAGYGIVVGLIFHRIIEKPLIKRFKR